MPAESGPRIAAWRKIALIRRPRSPVYLRGRQSPSQLRIHGFHSDSRNFANFAVYGSDAAAIEDLIRENPDLARPLHPLLRYWEAEVVWAVREEMARTVEDVLARHTRALFLNAKAAYEVAPRTAALVAQELHVDKSWEAAQVKTFQRLARSYMIENRSIDMN